MKTKDANKGNLSPSFIKAFKQVVRGKEPEPKKVSEQLDEIAGEICDNYCKYPALYSEENEDLLYTEICGKCPLMKL